MNYDFDHTEDIFRGNQSINSKEIFRAIRAVRHQIRRHCIPEGMFGTWYKVQGWPARTANAWELWAQFEQIAGMHGIVIKATWQWPTGVLVLATRGQWISIRILGLPMTNLSEPELRLFAQVSALTVFFGAGGQDELKDFEAIVEVVAKRAMKG